MALGLGIGSGEIFRIAVGEQGILSGIAVDLFFLRLANIFLSMSGLSFVPIMHFMQLDVIPNLPELFTVTQVKIPFFLNESCNFSLLTLLMGSLMPRLLCNGLALGSGWTNLTLPVPSSGWSCPLVPCSHGCADAAGSPLGWAAGPSSDSRSELAPSELQSLVSMEISGKPRLTLGWPLVGALAVRRSRWAPKAGLRLCSAAAWLSREACFGFL